MPCNVRSGNAICFSKWYWSEHNMAQHVKQVKTHTHASVVQDDADTDTQISGSFSQHGHSTNSIYLQ